MSPKSRNDIDPASTITLTPAVGRCGHATGIRGVHPSARGCEDCLRIGAAWVHLRICMTCGHVGCCDSSPHRHATKHFHATSASDRQVDRAGRAVGLVLCRRGDAVNEVSAQELRRVEVFGGLPDDQLAWLAGNGDLLLFKTGETVFRAGDPADSMIVILEGALELLIGIGGQLVPTFVQYAGEVTGLLPFSRMQHYTGAGRAAGIAPRSADSQGTLPRDAAADPRARPAARVGRWPIAFARRHELPNSARRCRPWAHWRQGWHTS